MSGWSSAVHRLMSANICSSLSFVTALVSTTIRRLSQCHEHLTFDPPASGAKRIFKSLSRWAVLNDDVAVGQSSLVFVGQGDDLDEGAWLCDADLVQGPDQRKGAGSHEPAWPNGTHLLSRQIQGSSEMLQHTRKQAKGIAFFLDCHSGDGRRPAGFRAPYRAGRGTRGQAGLGPLSSRNLVPRG